MTRSATATDSSATASSATTAGRPKAIYVMGAGRSGSTLLGVILGNCEGVFCAGELDAWLRRSGVPNFSRPDRDRFWHAVREQVGGGQELFGERAWRCLEHSLAVFRVADWGSRRRLRARYRQVTEDLYRAIAEVSGSAHVVDTSHYPLRARELRRIAGMDVYLIHLVRDPRNVVWSFARREVDQPPKAPLSTNLYLSLTNLLASLVFLTHPRERRLFLRYEDLVADPERITARILETVGVPATPPPMSELKTGVAFQGNRMLGSPVIALRDGAQPGTRASLSLLTAALQLPWELVFRGLKPRAKAT